MLTFLAAWNPLRAPWTEREDRIAELRDGRPAMQTWGVRTKAIQTGDSVYFIRLGKVPRGIFASATAVAPSYKAPHWDPAKRQAGISSWYVTCRFDVLLDVDVEPVLDLQCLREHCSATMGWSVQGSGVLVPEPVAIRLHGFWEQHIRQLRP